MISRAKKIFLVMTSKVSNIVSALLTGFSGLVADPMVTDSNWFSYNIASQNLKTRNNNNLEFFSVTSGNTATSNVYVRSVDEFPIADTVILKYDVIGNRFGCQVTHDYGLYQFDYKTSQFSSFAFQHPDDKIKVAKKNAAGTLTQTLYSPYNNEATVSCKLVVNPNDALYYVWNGSSWDLLHTFASHGITGTLKATFSARNYIAEIGDLTTISNVYITNTDFETQNPA